MTILKCGEIEDTQKHVGVVEKIELHQSVKIGLYNRRNSSRKNKKGRSGPCKMHYLFNSETAAVKSSIEEKTPPCEFLIKPMTNRLRYIN
jgi:hypothetical protein